MRLNREFKKRILGLLAGSSHVTPLTYIEPIDGPTFSSPTILASTDSGNGRSIITSYLAGKRQLLLRGAWNIGVLLDGLVGSRGLDIEIMNEDGTTQCGLASDDSHHGLSTQNNTNFVKLWGKNKNFPFNATAGDGQSAIVFGPIATVTNRGLVSRAYNTMGLNVGYAYFLFSIGILGSEYKTTVHAFNKGKGLVGHLGISGGDGGEGGYYGHDDPSVQSPFRWLVSLHHAWMDRARESEQFRYIFAGVAYNRTARNVGRVVGQPGQNNLSQFQDCNMFDLYFLEDGAPILENIITHGLTRQHGFSRYDGGASSAGYIGKANDHFPGSPRLNASYAAGVKKIIIRDRIIYADAATPYAYLIEETDCDIDFINIILTDNHSTLFSDIRGAHSNVITVTNVTYVPKATIPLPTYMSDDVTSKNFCRVTSLFHYNLGLGALTPVPGDQAIVDIFEIADISVAFGTAFGTNGAGLGLPATGSWMLSNGLFQTLAITWAIGSYDANTSGTYSVFGTPTVITGVANPYSRTLEAVITVLGPPTVKIRFGGSAIDYIADGTWNHYTANFSTPAGPTVNNSGDTRASMINSVGTLMGWQLAKTAGNFDGQKNGQNSIALGFPALAVVNAWESFSGAFKITGMTVGHAYIVRILCSVSSGVAGSHTVTVVVTGSTTNTYTSFNEKGNTTLFVDGTSTGFSMQPNGSGEILFTVTPTAGKGVVCLIEIAQL